MPEGGQSCPPPLRARTTTKGGCCMVAPLVGLLPRGTGVSPERGRPAAPALLPDAKVGSAVTAAPAPKEPAATSVPGAGVAAAPTPTHICAAKSAAVDDVPSCVPSSGELRRMSVMATRKNAEVEGEVPGVEGEVPGVEVEVPGVEDEVPGVEGGEVAALLLPSSRSSGRSCGGPWLLQPPPSPAQLASQASEW